MAPVSRRGRQQLRDPEPGAEGQQQQQACGQHAQVPSRTGTDPQAPVRVEHQSPTGHLSANHDEDRQQQCRQGQTVQQLQPRQLEQVERHVAAEYLFRMIHVTARKFDFNA